MSNSKVEQAVKAEMVRADTPEEEHSEGNWEPAGPEYPGLYLGRSPFRDWTPEETQKSSEWFSSFSDND